MAYLMLDSVTSAVASQPVNVSWAENYTLHYYFTGTGTVTALTIDFLGCIDNGEHWFTVDSHTFSAGELTAKSAVVFVTYKNLKEAKVSISTLTKTGDVYITALLQPNKA